MSHRPSFGHLALIYVANYLPLEVMQSAAGQYIGSRDGDAWAKKSPMAS